MKTEVTHNAELDRSEKIARKRKYNDNSDTHHIIEIKDNQSDDILGRIDECEKNLQKAESDARNWIGDNLDEYSEYGVMFKNIIGQLIGFIDN